MREAYLRVCVCVCVCMLVAETCLTLCKPMDCSPPGSSVHGIIPATILEWVVIYIYIYLTLLYILEINEVL